MTYLSVTLERSLERVSLEYSSEAEEGGMKYFIERDDLSKDSLDR